jgi:hypothetical protein
MAAAQAGRGLKTGQTSVGGEAFLVSVVFRFRRTEEKNRKGFRRRKKSEENRGEVA